MNPVISRHRLPQPYRSAIVFFWLLPIVMLSGAVVISHGFSHAVLDPRFLLPLLLMTLPALYIWQEGIDVREKGIVARVYVPRYYAYDQLDNWYFDQRLDRRVLTIWGKNGKVLEVRAGHLTGLPTLLRVLKDRLRWRGFPR